MKNNRLTGYFISTQGFKSTRLEVLLPRRLYHPGGGEHHSVYSWVGAAELVYLVKIIPIRS